MRASLPAWTMSAICSNSEGRKSEVALTFNSRRRGEVVCTPRGAPSGEDGAVGGGEHLRDGQIHFSGPSWSSEAEEALLFLTRVSGATRRSRRGGLSRAFTIYPLAGALARSGTTTGSLDRVRWGMYRIAPSTDCLLFGGWALTGGWGRGRFARI